MVNREMRSAVLKRYGGVDAYGDSLSTLISSTQIEVVFGLYTQTHTSDIRYTDATHYVLTKHKDITDKDRILINNHEYKVKTVNPYGRLTQVLLCQ